jgi:uncharacterized protein with HEPN domain
VSSREWRLRIEDILEAIDRIAQYTAPLTLESLAANTLVLDAVVRNFIVIGEAARNVPPEVERSYSRIPWAKMRGMRNEVVHSYFSIDVAILWETVTRDLPPLVAALQVILTENE